MNLINPTELNVAMLRKKVNASDMAKAIQKSRVSFDKKKFGQVDFSATEIYKLSQELDLTIEDVNIIFFDGKLPNGKKNTKT